MGAAGASPKAKLLALEALAQNLKEKDEIQLGIQEAQRQGGVSQARLLAGIAKAKDEMDKEAEAKGQAAPGVEELFPTPQIGAGAPVGPSGGNILPAGVNPAAAASGGAQAQILANQGGGGAQQGGTLTGGAPGVQPTITSQRITEGQREIPGRFRSRTVPTAQRTTDVRENVLSAGDAAQLDLQRSKMLFDASVKMHNQRGVDRDRKARLTLKVMQEFPNPADAVSIAGAINNLDPGAMRKAMEGAKSVSGAGLRLTNQRIAESRAGVVEARARTEVSRQRLDLDRETEARQAGAEKSRQTLAADKLQFAKDKDERASGIKEARLELDKFRAADKSTIDKARLSLDQLKAKNSDEVARARLAVTEAKNASDRELAQKRLDAVEGRAEGTLGVAEKRLELAEKRVTQGQQRLDQLEARDAKASELAQDKLDISRSRLGIAQSREKRAAEGEVFDRIEQLYRIENASLGVEKTRAELKQLKDHAGKLDGTVATYANVWNSSSPSPLTMNTAQQATRDRFQQESFSATANTEGQLKEGVGGRLVGLAESVIHDGKVLIRPPDDPSFGESIGITPLGGEPGVAAISAPNFLLLAALANPDKFNGIVGAPREFVTAAQNALESLGYGSAGEGGVFEFEGKDSFDAVVQWTVLGLANASQSGFMEGEIARVTGEDISRAELDAILNKFK